MKKTIQLSRSGNSKAARIPKPFLTQLGIDDTIDIKLVGEAIVITKPKKSRKLSLEDMLIGVTPEDISPLEWGRDVGNEVVDE